MIDKFTDEELKKIKAATRGGYRYLEIWRATSTQVKQLKNAGLKGVSKMQRKDKDGV